MNGIKILPVPCRITLPLAYTLTEKEKNKTHAIANKKNVCVKELHMRAYEVVLLFSIVGGLPFKE